MVKMIRMSLYRPIILESLESLTDLIPFSFCGSGFRL